MAACPLVPLCVWNDVCLGGVGVGMFNYLANVVMNSGGLLKSPAIMVGVPGKLVFILAISMHSSCSCLPLASGGV